MTRLGEVKKKGKTAVSLNLDVKNTNAAKIYRRERCSGSSSSRNAGRIRRKVSRRGLPAGKKKGGDEGLRLSSTPQERDGRAAGFHLGTIRKKGVRKGGGGWSLLTQTTTARN